jgi:hypothetical protein
MNTGQKQLVLAWKAADFMNSEVPLQSVSLEGKQHFLYRTGHN